MNKTTLTAAASLLLLAACEEGSHDNEHGHGDHTHADHSHGEPAVAAPDSPIEATAGALKVTLTPSADALRLQVADAEGQPVKPAGEARVVLTGTGEKQQRIVLSPDGDGWSGPAKASGAPGYIAVVSFKHNESDESARLTWGEVPEPEAAPAPAEEDDGHDGDHEHGHGHEH